MISAKYNGIDTIWAYGLTQYDYGQILNIDGLKIADGSEVHFCQGEKAITQYILDNQVSIPDYFLQFYNEIHAYIYLINEKSGKTVSKIILPIRPRERPGNYVSPEEPAYSRLLPPGGKAGQILARGPDGYLWKDPEEGKEASELEIYTILEDVFGGIL